MKNKILSLMQANMPDVNVIFEGEPDCQFMMTVVSANFEGLGPVKRQQAVYQVIGSLIESGELHAISMKTYTPTEWSQQDNSDL